MSTKITIEARRGTTSYQFVVEHDNYDVAEREAALFEAWLNKQPERQTLNDARSQG